MKITLRMKMTSKMKMTTKKSYLTIYLTPKNFLIQIFLQKIFWTKYFFGPIFFYNNFIYPNFLCPKIFDRKFFRFKCIFKFTFTFKSTFKSTFKVIFNTSTLPIPLNRMPALRQLIHYCTTRGTYYTLPWGIFLKTFWNFSKCYCHNPNSTSK